MDVRSAMTPNPAACSADTPLCEVAKLMRDNDCGQIPVIDAAGHPVGVVTDRDIVVRLLADGRDPNAACASACMSTPAMTMPKIAQVAVRSMRCVRRCSASRVRSSAASLSPGGCDSRWCSSRGSSGGSCA